MPKKESIMTPIAIVLAAGKGTRMNSEILKVAHYVAGKPIVNYILDTLQQLSILDICLVIGHQADMVKKITHRKGLTYVLQEKQLGTAHAVRMAESYLKSHKDSDVIVLAGDCPLISVETLKNLMAIHQESNALGSILTTRMPDPDGYGRILRGKMGTIMGIREAKDCTSKELSINEVNTGIYCFKSHALLSALEHVKAENKQQEYYLTDVVEILKSEGAVIQAYCSHNHGEVTGINTRMDLAKINEIIYERNNIAFMKEGVTIIDPKTTFIDSTVTIGRDTIVYPFTMIQGTAHIEARCQIGPNTFIRNGNVAEGTVLPAFSHIDNGSDSKRI
ncbi:MAG: bifunctional N-acetylglucosamine-1-phosphate uridyltransferase/glucosamine-1-phosphate acetyltransferase [Candidatus Margulisbacteria bacterium]|nr:bifunctional N-acetylglucosamine-1-phosphate uridyltransferase/glucosamine-1-phosphate acetyltransferase [Candidatus Margulisiibacteriota bacterium]